jgi:hypothetical protein
MTGSGLIMKFADADGTLIDVYQAHTHMTDEAGQPYPATVNALLDKAVGPEGYYGLFTANMHTDLVNSPGADAIVASAQTRGVPIISAKQALDWVEGHAASRFQSFSWSGSTLTFTVSAAAGTTGIQALLPIQSPSGTLTALSRGGTAVAYTTETVKGISYARFAAPSGSYSAVYGG